ncbi:MAG: hypothetical protein ACOX0E_00535 [Syntrophomonadaceae bacterium]
MIAPKKKTGFLILFMVVVSVMTIVLINHHTEQLFRGRPAIVQSQATG